MSSEQSLSDGAVAGDQALLAGLVAGDEAAYEALVQRHWAVPYRVALREGASLDEAEDVRQETFIRLWRYRHSFVDLTRPTLAPWLAFVAARLRIEQARRARRQAPWNEVLDRTVLCRPLDGPEEALALNELLAQLARAFDAVRPTYPDVETLCFNPTPPPNSDHSRSWYATRRLRALRRVRAAFQELAS